MKPLSFQSFGGQFHWRQYNISFVEVSTIRDAILRSSTTAKDPTNSHFRCRKHAWRALISLSLYQEKLDFRMTRKFTVYKTTAILNTGQYKP